MTNEIVGMGMIEEKDRRWAREEAAANKAIDKADDEFVGEQSSENKLNSRQRYRAARKEEYLRRRMGIAERCLPF